MSATAKETNGLLTSETVAAMATAVLDDLRPAPTPEPPPIERGRYAEAVAFFTDQLATKREARRFAQMEQAARLLDRDIEQLEAAIEVFTEAATIEPKMTQFGTHLSSSWNTRVPPALEETRADPRRMILANYYRFQTDDPVYIATLRRLIRHNGLEGLTEMEPGLMPSIGPTGAFAGWVEAKFYAAQKAAGQLREW